MTKSVAKNGENKFYGGAGGRGCWTVSGSDCELEVSLVTGTPVHCTMYYVWFRVTHFLFFISLSFISLTFISLSLLPPLFFSFSLLHFRTYIYYPEYSIRRQTQLEREERDDFGGCLGSRKKGGGGTLSTLASSTETMNGFRRELILIWEQAPKTSLSYRE